MSNSVILWTAAHQAPLSMDSPVKNTGVGCHAHVRGIFLTQDQIPVFYVSQTGWSVLYHYLHLGSPVLIYANQILNFVRLLLSIKEGYFGGKKIIKMIF